MESLIRKGLEFPDSVAAFSGYTRRSHFRQIRHGSPRSRYDQHPNLYYLLSGTESLPDDEIVDVVQGFTGVLIRPRYFHYVDFLSLVKNITDRQNDSLMWKADDYIISGYLEQQNITRRVVVGGSPPNLNKGAAGKDNLGSGMHRQAMSTAFDLQHRLDIWQNYNFVNYTSLSQHQQDLVDCEAGHSWACKKVTGGGNASSRINRPEDVTKILDELLL